MKQTNNVSEEQYTIDTTPFRVKLFEPDPGPSGDRLRKYNALKLNIDIYKTMWGSEYDDGAVQVETLSPQSHKKVWAVCIQCGKGRWITYRQYHHLCNSCSHSGERCSEETRKKQSAAKYGKNNHMFGKTISEETRKKMSDAKSGENNPNFGKHHSEETRIKMSVNHTDVHGENHPLFGKHKSEETRIKMSCARQGIPVEEFTGFLSSGTYGKYCSKFNEALKERIREKYSRKCLLCQLTEKENIEKYGHKLSIHHVDYNKQCGCDGNECRLVPLCSKCHPKTNGNRSRWEQLIMQKIVELFPDINFDNPQTSLEDFYILPCESTSPLHTPTRNCICQTTLF